MPKISALGGMSSRGFGEFAQQTAANYIEDVFSTWLYTGNESSGSGTTQTITNGIDLAGKGGMVWGKQRNGSNSNRIQDTVRGSGNEIFTNLTNAQNTGVSGITSFNSNGFTLGGAFNNWNILGSTYASWTFREQPKFFDIVTYTGNGAASQTISHNLGSVPGFIIVKTISGSASQWFCWHRSYTGPGLYLNNSTIFTSDNQVIGASPTASSFVVNDAGYNMNASGYTYVAYLFAHNAGGFGAGGSQNVISCGSFTDASGAVTLGYEPQFILYKLTSTADSWNIIDTMRGMDVSANTKNLYPNTSGAEASGFGPYPTATGFQVAGVPTGTYIYMAIRRGPMKTPTSGTSVFSPSIYTGTLTLANPNNRMLAATDSWFNGSRNASGGFYPLDRLRGWNYLQTTSNAAEDTSYTWYQSNQTTLQPTSPTNWWGSSTPQVDYYFQRAPGFMDVVCYTGTGAATTINHNLGVVPEMIIQKCRNQTRQWRVYHSALGPSKAAVLNADTVPDTSTTLYWNNTSPTSTVFSVGTGLDTNGSGNTNVAYLFVTCPGVSKVGSYTGTGATQTISCGFTGGARYVLIKRTDSTGSWWVWDTARGMVAGTDPRLAYNSIAAETNANWVYTTTGGFQIVTSDATVNASGGTYIYLAIA